MVLEDQLLSWLAIVYEFIHWNPDEEIKYYLDEY